MAWVVKIFVPDAPPTEKKTKQPKFLDPIMLNTPSLAMDIVRMELGRLGATALHMMRGALDTVLQGTLSEIETLQEMDDDVDALHGAVVTYLGRLSRENLSERQSRQLHDYLAAANYIRASVT